MTSPPNKFNCVDYLSDRGPPEFSGIHGWVDEVRNWNDDLLFLKLFWNSKGKKHVNTNTYCSIEPPLGAAGVITGKDHKFREFMMEHIGNADFDTEETRARQHHTPPRKSISHPGGARAGRSRAGWGGRIPGREFPGREIPRRRSIAG